ncbi:MAG TPA: hypothetical protein VEA59_05610 [Patescibacteria group bacterium]|nr:hypothetical protein [Patescibacteria group bacterium]
MRKQKQNPPNNKTIFILCTVLIVAIASLSIFNRKAFEPAPILQSADAQNYQKILASYKTDEQASREVFEQLVSKEEVAAEIYDTLGTNRTIPIPKEPEKPLLPVKAGASEVESAAVVSLVSTKVQEFYTQHEAVITNPYNNSTSDLAVTRTELRQQLETLYETQPTKESLQVQKNFIVWQESLDKSLASALNYVTKGAAFTPWPDIYRDLVVFNGLMPTLEADFNLTAKTLGLKRINKGFSLIKTAHALPVVIVGNPVEEIKDAIKKALATAFAKFATVFLDKLVQTIEKNYKIANFLYYSDALLSGQYLEDYLNKYVDDPLDKTLIKKFIPQLSCGKTDPKLGEVFKAKAREYLGYDPASLSASDPDFNVKLARMGSFLSTPQGWELRYRELAAVAKSEAEKNVDRELFSSGLKSPRELISNQIAATLSAIEHSESAALLSSINLGVIHVDSIVGQLVSGILENLFNKFLFKGAVVFKEQSTCLIGGADEVVIPAKAVEEDDTEVLLRGDEY